MNTTITLFDNQAHRDLVIALWNAVFGYESAHNEPSLVIDKKLAADDGLEALEQIRDETLAYLHEREPTLQISWQDLMEACGEGADAILGPSI